jgi:hypothetical protein
MYSLARSVSRTRFLITDPPGLSQQINLFADSNRGEKPTNRTEYRQD